MLSRFTSVKIRLPNQVIKHIFRDWCTNHLPGLEQKHWNNSLPSDHFLLADDDVTEWAAPEKMILLRTREGFYAKHVRSLPRCVYLNAGSAPGEAFKQYLKNVTRCMKAYLSHYTVFAYVTLHKHLFLHVSFFNASWWCWIGPEPRDVWRLLPWVRCRAFFLLVFKLHEQV